VKVERLIDLTNELEDLMERLSDQGFSIMGIRARVMQEDGQVDVLVDSDHNVTVQPQK